METTFDEKARKVALAKYRRKVKAKGIICLAGTKQCREYLLSKQGDCRGCSSEYGCIYLMSVICADMFNRGG